MGGKKKTNTRGNGFPADGDLCPAGGEREGPGTAREGGGERVVVCRGAGGKKGDGKGRYDLRPFNRRGRRVRNWGGEVLHQAGKPSKQTRKRRA